MDCPYPWFGGKARVADLVWSALGNPDLYIEPFFGGGAVLLKRPRVSGREVINDLDGFVTNFWRAVQADPAGLSRLMSWPINEIDQTARHRWLCTMPQKAEFLDRMKRDPEFFDIKRAAWWCWGLCRWVGRGWCGGEYYPDHPARSHGAGIGNGEGKRPCLGDPRGIFRRTKDIDEWMAELSARMRRVIVCCGDWTRVCTDGATSHGSSVGVFLDPPYSHYCGRDPRIYMVEAASVSADVREWCKARSNQPRFKIVLAGYEGEHDELESMGWGVREWTTQGGMANRAIKQSRGKANRHRERLWFSPSCNIDRDALFCPAWAASCGRPRML